MREGAVAHNKRLPAIAPVTMTHSSPPQVPDPSPKLSLETPLASGDFEWDERIVSNVDGMASLTDRYSRGGYLGVTSGAALLRLADTGAQPVIDANDGDLTRDEPSQVHTPIAMVSYPLSQLEPFVDAYFQLYHVSYPIIHEATFRAQVSVDVILRHVVCADREKFMEVIPRPRQKAWQVLLYIIAALGAFTTSTSVNDLDVALFEAAKARLSIDMLETGNLIFVQALTLISNYVQKRNKPNSGYNYTGLAKRVALGIGLHKEFATWRTKPLMLEIRRRAWWALFVFDVGASITFSRPLDLPDGGVEVSLPLNVHDTDITSSTRHNPPETTEVTLYTHVRCQSQFHLATGSIYARLLSTPFPDAKELLDLDDVHIDRFIGSLPAYFAEGVEQAPKYRLCHAILRWRYRNFRILMYRTFVIRHMMLDFNDTRDSQPQVEEEPNTFDNTAIRRCLDAAAETVDLITTFWQNEKRSMMACWYGLYFLFQAILVPVICLRNQPGSVDAPSWRDQILRASEVIADMSSLNPAASRCHATIMALSGAYLNQGHGNWNEPVQESPQTQLNGLYPFMWPMLDVAQDEGYDFAQHEFVIQDFMNQISGT